MTECNCPTNPFGVCISMDCKKCEYNSEAYLIYIQEWKKGIIKETHGNKP